MLRRRNRELLPQPLPPPLTSPLASIRPSPRPGIVHKPNTNSHPQLGAISSFNDSIKLAYNYIDNQLANVFRFGSKYNCLGECSFRLFYTNAILQFNYYYFFFNYVRSPVFYF